MSLRTLTRRLVASHSIALRNGKHASSFLLRAYSTKRYTEQHEWVEVVDGVGTVGITDHAQNALGDIVYAEVTAEINSAVKQGGSIGSVESVKAASEVYAPVSGTVVDVNEKLSGTPSVINTNAEGDGWLCKIKLSHTTELDRLMDLAAYEEHVANEAS